MPNIGAQAIKVACWFSVDQSIQFTSDALEREGAILPAASPRRQFNRESRVKQFLQCLAMGCFTLVVGLSSVQAQQTMSPLVSSVLAEDIEGARAALDAGASPNALDPELQRSALHIAVSPGSPRNATMVELLASRGVDLNAEDARTKLTPLMAATIVVEASGPFAVLEFQKSKLIVERLLNLGADAGRATQEGETPLLVAVSAGNMEVLRLLIARGAKPDQAGPQGETALARATKQQRQDMISALLAAGAKPMASAPQFAARGVGDAADADADTAPATQGAAAPGSSGIGRWLIGGLVVAAGVVAAAAAANNAKNRRNAQNQPVQPQQFAQQLACAPGYTLINGFCQPLPALVCNAPQVLQNGQCITPAATAVWIIPVITMLVSMNGQLGILSGPNQGTYAGWSYRLTWCHPGAPSNCIDFKTMLSYTPQDALEDRELPKTAAAAANAMWREVQRINEALYKRGRAGYPPAAIFTSIIDASIQEGLAAKSVAVAVLAARARLATAGFPVDVASTP